MSPIVSKSSSLLMWAFNPDGCGYSKTEVPVRDTAEAAKAARYHHRFIK